MPEYVNQSLFMKNTPSVGRSVLTVDSKLIKYGQNINKLSVNSLKVGTNIKNKNFKTLNISSSCLPNHSYYKFKTIKPTVVYSLKKK